MTRCRLFLWVIIFTYFVLFFFYGLFRHWGFLTTFVDLAKYDREILHVIATGTFFSTYSVHFDPIHLIFVPFYLIYPSVGWIIGAQALAVSITAWIVFSLAARVTDSEKTGLIWALIFLVNPFLLNAAAWDVDTITLAVPFVALAFWAMEARNFKVALVATVFILACKEHLGILVFGFGLLWWIRNKEWKQGLALISIGILHFYLVIQVIIPSLSPTGQHIMMGAGHGTATRYTWLGSSLSGIIATIIQQPLATLKTIMFSMGGLGYLFLLLLPFLFLPLLNIFTFLPAAADLAANMLSSNPMPRSPMAYHSAALIPIFTAAAIYGVHKLSRWQKKFSVTELSVLVLIASTLLGYFFAPLPLPGAKNIWAPATFINLPDARVQEIRSLLGADTAISVQANIGAHFSQNQKIYRYAGNPGRADAVILWLESPTTNIHNYAAEKQVQRRYITGMLDNHLQMDRVDYLASVEKLLHDDEFGIAYWNAPWLVFKRGVNGHAVGPEVMGWLEGLEAKWLR